MSGLQAEDGVTLSMDALSALLLARAALRESVVVLSFDEIEVLTGPLPPAAAREKRWWHGRKTTQSRAWESAGWTVDTVGFAAKRVAFRLRD